MDLGDITGKAQELIGENAGKAQELLGEHAEAIEGGIDKVAEFADDKTGGKYTEQIDGAADKLKGLLPKDGA
ncbi:MAG: antitoxin [Acidimicrobiales bacterium]